MKETSVQWSDDKVFQNFRLLEQARSTLTPPDHVTCSQYAANRIARETFGTVWAGLGGRKEIGAGLLAGTRPARRARQNPPGIVDGVLLTTEPFGAASHRAKREVAAGESRKWSNFCKR